METDGTNINIAFQVFIQNMSAIKVFKPVLISFSLLDSTLLQLLYNIFLVNANYKVVADHINAILLLNTL